MLTGEETTSTTMCWILKFLSENPGVQRRLHEELVRVLPDPGERSPTFEEISGMGGKTPCESPSVSSKHWSLLIGAP